MTSDGTEAPPGPLSQDHAEDRAPVGTTVNSAGGLIGHLDGIQRLAGLNLARERLDEFLPVGADPVERSRSSRLTPVEELLALA